MKVLFDNTAVHCGVVEGAGRWIPLMSVYLAGAARGWHLLTAAGR